MAVKFGRNYVLTIDNSTLGTSPQTIVQPPFTIDFDITRNTLTSANISSIRIYNLAPNTRNAILKDWTDLSAVRQIELRAGYGANTSSFPILFTGYITQAWSFREGVNFITEIQSFDGGNAYQNAKIQNLQFAEGTPYDQVINQLILAMKPYGVTRGKVVHVPGVTNMGYSLTGNPLDELRNLIPELFFIDNGTINVLGQSDIIGTPNIPLINSASGLLGTPLRENQLLIFDTLLEPSLFIGQEILLQSSTGPVYNAQYKVVSLHHRGTISNQVCGDATTSIGVFYTKAFQKVNS